MDKKYTIGKESLKFLLEDIVWNKLQKDNYNIETIEANNLLTYNRLDLAFKIFYLLYKDKNLDLAKKIYYQDIKSQTLGKFQEGQTDKDSFEKFLIEFDNTFNNIKNNGFNSSKTLIPLSKNKTIRNGAHRVSSAILLNETVDCIITEENDMIADYKYFLERGFPIDYIEKSLIKFIEYAPENVYIAFLWPSGKDKTEESLSKFKNIVYTKEIQLNSNGGYNLLFELYKHMDWIGNKENGFSGIKQKLIECFPSFDKFRVVVFQADALKDVRVIKEKVRKIHNIGFSSIHITDTKEEAIRISKLIFNDNGLHFLNNALPYKFNSIYKELDRFKNYLEENKVNSDDIILDGSIVLSLYGIRENKDIDYLILDEYLPTKKNELYETHDSELKYHKAEKKDLIYDSNYFFEFYGLKFVSFEQLYQMKKDRAEIKDKTDIQLMNLLLEGKSGIKKSIIELKQKFLYWKIKYKFKFRNHIVSFLKYIRLFNFIKNLLRKGMQR